MKRLLLHVGAPKCGSSALQSALELHSSLNSIGVDYPKLHYRGHGQGNGAAFFEFFRGAKSQKLKELQCYISKVPSDCETMVISDETLYGVIDKEKMASFLEVADGWFDQVDVLVAVREPSSWLLSDYSQFAKQGKPVVTFAEHCASREFDCNWPIQLRRFCLSSPKLTVHAVDYRSLLPFVSEYIGLDKDELSDLLSKSEGNINLSLSDEDIERIRLKMAGVDDKLIPDMIRGFSLRECHKTLLEYLLVKYKGYESRLPSGINWVAE